MDGRGRGLNDGDKFRGCSFEHFKNFDRKFKEWDSGALYHKFPHGRQTIVGQGHLV